MEVKRSKKWKVVGPLFFMILDILFLGLFLYYYLSVETDTKCFANYTSNEPITGDIPYEDVENVSDDYDFVLLALIVSGGIDLIYEIMNLLALSRPAIKTFNKYLRINDLLSFLIIIMMHVY